MDERLQEMERPNSAYLLVYDRLQSHAAASTSTAAVPQVCMRLLWGQCLTLNPEMPACICMFVASFNALQQHICSPLLDVDRPEPT